MWDAIIGSVIGAASVSAAIVFVIRNIVGRAIEREFAKRMRLDDARARLAEESAKSLLQTEHSLYPGLAEVVYRARNAVQVMVAQSVMDWDVEGFAIQVYRLTDDLYKYRVFLPATTFDDLHRLKHRLQEFRVLLDQALVPGPAPIPEVDTSVRAAMSEKAEDIDKLHNRIMAGLKDLLEKRATSLLVNESSS